MDGFAELPPNRLARPLPQQCKICTEYRPELKQLTTCGHCFCSSCINRWSRSADIQNHQVSCPVCRQVTELPNGDVECLRTIFDGKLKCFECDGVKPMNDCWWCSTCSSVICSKCTLVSHREHHFINYDPFIALSASCAWMKQQISEEMTSKSWTCYALMHLMDEICERITRNHKKQETSRKEIVQIMQTLLERYGMQDCGENVSHANATTYPVVLQQLLHLAGITTTEKSLETCHIDHSKILLQELKEEIQQLTLNNINEAMKFVLQASMKESVSSLPIPKSELSIVHHQNLLQPVDLCILPFDALLVADAKKGLLLFSANDGCVKFSCMLDIDSVCYDEHSSEIIAVISREQKIKFLDADLNLKQEGRIPSASRWLRIRANKLGILYMVSCEISNDSIYLYRCVDRKKWQVVTIFQHSGNQFFNFIIMSNAEPLVNMEKLLCLTDTGNMIEISVDSVNGKLLNRCRKIIPSNLNLVAPSAMTVSQNGDIVIADSGLLHEINNNYIYKRIIGSVDPKDTITSLQIQENSSILWIAIPNRRCVAKLKF